MHTFFRTASANHALPGRLLRCLAYTLLAALLLEVRQAPLHAQSASLEHAIHAVVRIRGCAVRGCNEGVGSGAIIDPSGLILTAHHVTLTNPIDVKSPQYEDFVVEVTDDARELPVARFRARVAAQKADADLALLQVYWDELASEEIEPSGLELAYLPLADPAAVIIGEELSILGYPIAGGSSINLAKEGLSGFDAEGSLLKVQKSLSEGNSGGPALVKREDGYEIAGVVIRRRGKMGEVGLLRSIGELHGLTWSEGSRRAAVNEVAVTFDPDAATPEAQAHLDMRLFDMAGQSVKLMVYAFDGESHAPYSTPDQAAETTVDGQLVLSAVLVPQTFVAQLGDTAVALPAAPPGVELERLAFRLLLWDVQGARQLWSDKTWRRPQPQMPANTPTPTDTSQPAATDTPTMLPTSTDTPVPSPTATTTPTPTPTATPTPLPTPTPTATATPTPGAELLNTLTGHRGIVWSVAWSPDGYAVVSGGDDESVRIWDVLSGNELIQFDGHTGQVASVAWSPDGSLIASAGSTLLDDNPRRDTTVRIWSAATGAILKVLTGHTDEVETVAWSPDGRYLASGSDDSYVHLWDARSFAWVRTLAGHADTVVSLAWSPDSTALVSGSDDRTARVWDVTTGELLLPRLVHRDEVESVTWSPDGTQIGTSDKEGAIALWDTRRGVQGQTWSGYIDAVRTIAWSPTGVYLATGDVAQRIVIWDASTGAQRFVLVGHKGPVRSVAWSPDGRYLASASEDGTIKVWQIP